jgi:hypothetical protein
MKTRHVPGPKDMENTSEKTKILAIPAIPVDVLEYAGSSNGLDAPACHAIIADRQTAPMSIGRRRPIRSTGMSAGGCDQCSRLTDESTGLLALKRWR